MAGSVRLISDVSLEMVADVGGKAAGLGEMHAAGLSVPTGFVVPVEAYRRHLSRSCPLASNFDSDRMLECLPTQLRKSSREVCGAMRGVSIEALLERDIRKAVSQIADLSRRRSSGPVRFVIRPSTYILGEPFARLASVGQSFLGVTSHEDVVDGVVTCWTSAWSETALAERLLFGLDSEVLGIAVIVQVMINPTAVGATVTGNPIFRRHNELLVSVGCGSFQEPDTDFGRNTAVSGFGISRVGDQPAGVSAHHRIRYRWHDGIAVAVFGPEGEAECLSEGEKKELFGAGRRARDHFDSPQTLEWFRDVAGLHFVQATPALAANGCFVAA